jgi:hypothetical protein
VDPVTRDVGNWPPTSEPNRISLESGDERRSFDEDPIKTSAHSCRQRSPCVGVYWGESPGVV